MNLQLHVLLLLLVLGWVHGSSLESATVESDTMFLELLQQMKVSSDAHSVAPREMTKAGVSPLDALIDFLLAGAVPQIISHGKSALPLPDFSFHFNATLGNEFRVESDVRAFGGALQDVRSLFRQGPAVLRRAQGGVLLLEAAAGVRLLRVSYSKYTATLNGPLASGQVELEVSPVAVSAQLALAPPCTVHLRQLQVSELGSLHAKITGLPQAFIGLPKMIENLFQYPAARQAITGVVVQRVAEMITLELKRLSC